MTDPDDIADYGEPEPRRSGFCPDCWHTDSHGSGCPGEEEEPDDNEETEE